jgi:uroporphyrinogen decarboxylase
MINKMTPKERFESAINNEKPDRIPLAYLFFGAGDAVLRALELNFKDVYYSSKGIVKAQLKALELFGHDNVNTPWGCLNVEAESFGCKITIKKDGYPVTNGPIVNSYEDLESLEVPDPEESGRMPIVLESIEAFNKELGAANPIIGFTCSPAIVAAEIRGFENLLMDTVREPRYLKEILKAAEHLGEEYIEAMVHRGAFAVMIENSCSGKDVLDPVSCDKYVVEYNRNIVKKLKKLGAYSIIYNSSCQPYLEKDLSIKPDILSFHRGDGDAILDEYGWNCDKFHDRIGACIKRYCISMVNNACLMGNVDHANTMLKGTYNDAYREAINCLESSRKRDAGFILSTGCEVPFNAPITNMLALRDAAKNFII